MWSCINYSNTISLSDSRDQWCQENGTTTRENGNPKKMGNPKKVENQRKWEKFQDDEHLLIHFIRLVLALSLSLQSAVKEEGWCFPRITVLRTRIVLIQCSELVVAWWLCGTWIYYEILYKYKKFVIKSENIMFICKTALPWYNELICS